MNTQHGDLGFLGLGRHGFHRVAYTEWGRAGAGRAVVCVHGLTRNGRDFDYLAAELTQGPENDYLVVCPDLPGRGHSHWLGDPEEYGLALYLSDMTALIARLGVDQVDWIGTSLGGLIGMTLAAQPNSPVRSLVINDIGPFVPATALQRIGEYVGHDEKFTNFDALKTYLMNVHAGFGDLDDEQWDHLSRHSGHRNDDGSWRLHYDPSIAIAFHKAAAANFDLWPLWEQITCPVLILRGEDSDILTRDTAHQMLERGPAADLIEFPACAHAPSLMEEAQIEVVINWLDSIGR